MDFDDYRRWDALGLAGLVKMGEVTPDELLGTALERAAAVEPAINSIALDFAEHARDAIARGLPDGPFTGVPMLIKDLFVHLAGLPMTNGSRFAPGTPSDHDTILGARFRDAGFAIFGRSSSAEFGLCTSTEPVRHGPTRNPWDTGRIAGGSSGGASAAVAAGILPAAHASDGGGSIRIPAACCGLFGLKPTRGRITSGPDVGEGWNGLSAALCVSRSVRDSAAILDVLRGPSPGDPYWAVPPDRPYLEEVGTPPGRLRIALATESFNGMPTDPACAEAVRQAGKMLEDLGHTVEEAHPGHDGDAYRIAQRTIVAVNTALALAGLGEKIGRAAGPDDVEHVTWELAERGRSIPGTEFQRAIQTVHRTSRVVGRFMENHDAILSPAMGVPVPEIGWLDTMNLDLDTYSERLLRTTAFTALFNGTGMPAMVLPLFTDANGLPLGVQIAGRYADETTLIRLAAQVEAAHPWDDRLPRTPEAIGG